MGSGSKNSTTVQKADPWGPAQPYLENVLKSSYNLAQDRGFAPDPYGGDRVADQSWGTRGAYDAVTGRGAGSPMIDKAFGAISPMMKSDPRLAPMMSGTDIYRDLGRVKQEALGGAIPAAVSMFSGNGMTDSSAAMDTVGRAATEAIAPIEYGAWNNAQDRRLSAIGQDNGTRLQAAGMAPGLQAASYLPAQMMAQFGGMQDAYRQREIDGRMARYYEGQNQGRDNLTGYAGLVSQIAGQGGNQSSTGPSGQPSGVAKVAGAGLGGLGAYGALMMNPATAPFALAGGGLAGLMGML
jgi:hypothetical protein